MKKHPSPSKEMLKSIILTGVVAGLSFVLFLLAILPFVAGKEFRNVFPTFQPVREKTDAAASPFTVSVSSDGTQYSSNIKVPVGGQYFLKTTPAHKGYLEVNLVGSAKPSKWNATNASGIAIATHAQLATITPGSYVASFRPWVATGTNPYAWSNQVNVFITGTETTVPSVSVSTDGITYSNKIEVTANQPYYLKMSPPVFGYYESRMKGSTLWNKWNFATSSGVATVSRVQMAKIAPGTYTAQYRPWVNTLPNTYLPSNEVTVVVKPYIRTSPTPTPNPSATTPVIPTPSPSVTPTPATSTAVVAKVSTNGINYFDSVTTTKKIGYYMKMNINYTGPVEVIFHNYVGIWYVPYTTVPFNAVNGVVRATPESLAKVGPGIFPAKFRPYITGKANPYAWSNQTIILQQDEVNAALTPGFRTEVSVDGINFSSSIVTTREKGYYLRVIPAYTGPMEALLDGKVFKWHDLTNGVKRVTAAELAGAKDGTYVARFRPYTTAATNPYPWGSVVTVVQNPSLGGKSTTLACTGLAQPNTTKMLNVGTWNIGGNNGQNNASGDALLDAKATTVGQKFKEFNLDVMIVQEVHPFRATAFSEPITKTNFNNRVKAASGINNLYFYSVYQPGSNHSVVTISKFPIEQSENKGIAGSRNISYALINSPAGKLKVFNVHLQRKDEAMCKGMEGSVNYIRSKILSGDDYIVGGDFNAEFDNRGFYEGNYNYCSYGQSFNQIFSMSCATAMCKYRAGTSSGGSGDVIDFILGGTSNSPSVYQYCKKDSYGVVDGHELYLSTVTL